MVESHSILQTDPFSYTFQSLNRPFVMHQWLSEIIFYYVYKLSGLAGLVYFCTFLVTASFTCIPLYFTTWLRKSYVIALIVIALAPLTTVVRLIARPELFAFVCLASWLILLARLRNTNEKSALRWRLIACFGLVMVLWTNLHSSFVLGVCLMLYFVAEDLFCYLVGRKNASSSRPFDFTAFIALAITTCATLCNPYGIGLLKYVSDLVSSPLKLFISEMMPITPENLAIPLVWPFLAFLFLCMAIIVQAFSEENGHADKLQQYHRIFSALLMVAMVVFAFSCRRYISFCALTLTFQIASFYPSRSNGSLTANIEP